MDASWDMSHVLYTRMICYMVYNEPSFLKLISDILHHEPKSSYIASTWSLTRAEFSKYSQLLTLKSFFLLAKGLAHFSSWALWDSVDFCSMSAIELLKPTKKPYINFFKVNFHVMKYDAGWSILPLSGYSNLASPLEVEFKKGLN